MDGIDPIGWPISNWSIDTILSDDRAATAGLDSQPLTPHLSAQSLGKGAELTCIHPMCTHLVCVGLLLLDHSPHDGLTELVGVDLCSTGSASDKVHVVMSSSALTIERLGYAVAAREEAGGFLHESLFATLLKHMCRHTELAHMPLHQLNIRLLHEGLDAVQLP